MVTPRPATSSWNVASPTVNRIEVAPLPSFSSKVRQSLPSLWIVKFHGSAVSKS